MCEFQAFPAMRLRFMFFWDVNISILEERDHYVVSKRPAPITQGHALTFQKNEDPHTRLILQ